MPKRRSLARRALFLVLLAVLAACIATWLLLRGSLPKLDGQINAAGLAKPASIERDALGTATIHAASRDDAMYLDLHDAETRRELAFSKIKAALGDKVYKFLSIHGGTWDSPLFGPALGYPELPGADDIDLRKLDSKLLQMPPPAVERAATP